MRLFLFRIFTVKKYFSLQWNIFSVFSLVSCRTTFFLIQPKHTIKREFFLFIRLKREKKYNEQKIHVFLFIQDLFSSCGMKSITFYTWLLSHVKYLFSCHSMKTNPVFIDHICSNFSYAPTLYACRTLNHENGYKFVFFNRNDIQAIFQYIVSFI
jgi:hypothetical protein